MHVPAHVDGVRSMHIELLRTPPLSGDYLERHYDVSARANTWVRFDDGEGAEWVGVFGNGDWVRSKAAVPFGDDGGRTVLVVAGGRGYVVNALTGDLVRRSSRDDLNRTAAVPGRDFVLAASTTGIWAIGRIDDRAAWSHGPDLSNAAPSTPVSETTLALDGVLFDEVRSDTACGKVWQPDGWYAFTLNLTELEFTRGPLLDAAWDAFDFRPGQR